MLRKRWLVAILICAVAEAGILVPLLFLTGAPEVVVVPADFQEAFEWMDDNLTAGTVIASWKDYGDYINTYTNCTALDFSNSTVVGLVGRLFMAENESETIEILNQLGASYLLVTWSYFYPGGGGDEGKYPEMLQSAAQELQGTEWEITVGERWNAASGKPTCEFFNTTLWKMLLYGEPFVDSTTDEALIEALLQQNYPFGYFQARLNWADPWIPGSAPIQGQWYDDSGHLWKDHNPPLGAGIVDDGVVDFDGDEDDDTVGQFANLNNFTPAFVSSGHIVKIFEIK